MQKIDLKNPATTPFMTFDFWEIVESHAHPWNTAFYYLIYLSFDDMSFFVFSTLCFFSFTSSLPAELAPLETDEIGGGGADAAGSGSKSSSIRASFFLSFWSKPPRQVHESMLHLYSGLYECVCVRVCHVWRR